jgi:hypothetical protein
MFQSSKGVTKALGFVLFQLWSRYAATSFLIKSSSLAQESNWFQLGGARDAKSQLFFARLRLTGTPEI